MNLHCVLACPIATGRFSKRIDLFKSLRYPEGPGALTAVITDLLKKKGRGGGVGGSKKHRFLISLELVFN